MINTYGFSVVRRLALILSLCMVIAACSETEPWRFGFVGGLSGRISDLGGPARNGMLLAVEEINAQGGIDGRLVETVIKDDQQNPELAKAAVQHLLAQSVDVIIGPVTSSMAVSVVDLANQAETLMMGVTVTTNDLSGKNDFFLRTLSATAVHAAEVADYVYDVLGIRSFAVVYDLKNKSYSQGWANDFSRNFKARGGIDKQVLSFESGQPEELPEIATRLLEGSPEMVLFVTNSVDAALLAKLVRSQNESVAIGTSEWAGTERLIEMGGKYVEGAIVPQYLDRESQEPAYLVFLESYRKRFNQEPGFPGMIAYNATKAIISTLISDPNAKALKQNILSTRRFSSVQGELIFDEFGDGRSKTYITKVEDGKFKVQVGL